MSVLLSSWPFKQSFLQFELNAMQNVISESIMHHHYNKHHAGYVAKLNQLLPSMKFSLNELDQLLPYTMLSLKKILKQCTHDTVIWNNAAQHHHHEVFWRSITPVMNDPVGQLNGFVTQKVVDLLVSKGIALFGSGWLWLTYDGMNVHVETTSNAAFPKYSILLAIDIWEHAYYLDYQQDRKVYLEKLVRQLNWEYAAERLSECDQRWDEYNRD